MYAYQTIKSEVRDILLKEKGSKFIGFAFPVNNEKELKIALESLNPNSAIEKKEYFSILISNCVAVEKNKR